MKARPTCDVCGVPVDGITESFDPWLDRLTITVRCHGETERVSLDTGDTRVGRIEFSRAFVRPRRLK